MAGYLLLLKNTKTRKVEVDKYSEKTYIFPTLANANSQGELTLKNEPEKYTAFSTMELEHFIERMSERFNNSL